MKEKLLSQVSFGVSKHNYVVTFPRGGSDITGAIIARGIKASLYENFTDVSGIFKANPNVIEHPELIEEITYREMRELSYAGFSVFHDEALQPLYKHRIPVVIKTQIIQRTKEPLFAMIVKSQIKIKLLALVAIKISQL